MLQYIALAPLAGKLLPVIRTTANMNHGTVRSVESKMELEAHYLDLSWILSNNSFIKHVYNMSAPSV